MKTFALRFLVVFLLLGLSAPALEPSALAASQKRPCSCSKRTVRRKTLRRTRAVAKTQTAPATGQNASLVGPVIATYTVPANQSFRLRLNQMISSERSRVGDRFTSTVLIPVYANGVEVVPAGSTVEGRLTAVTPARSRGREGHIAVVFDALVLPDGTRHQIDGVLTDLQDERGGVVDQESEVSGKSSETRNIGYIGGGSAGGAILGGAIGGGKGAGIGAAIGAGAGVAGVLLQKGHEVELRSGTEVGIITARPITFRIRER